MATLAKSNLLSAEQLAEMGSELVKAGSDAQLQTLAKKLVDRGLITRWQAEQLFAGRSVFFLGKYKLLDYIGKGGMGAVFKAQHALMARTVALKVMARALLEKPDAVARFKREVKSAAALNHPNIITAHDADCVGDTHFLVMEYVEGRDLKYWLEHRGPLAIGWVCECIRQVSLGLQHAHEKGMVHRDIKPSNLLVDSKDPNAPPLVKILDMGLARMVSEAKQEGGVTQTGQVMGTVDYVAPEQAEDAKLADIRSDIFSLGCTLFQLLTGQLPFGGDTLMAKLLARAKTGALPVRSLRSDVPPGLEAIVAKMLARDPAQRLQTPGEVAAALAPFALSSVPGQVPAAPTAPPAPTGTASSLITAQSEADSNFTEFLDFMARDVPTENWASVSQTVGDQCGSPSAPAAPPAAITAKPRLVVAIAAAAVVALLLCLGGVVLFLTRGSKPVALEDQAGTESSPSGATKGSKKRTKQPEVPQPWDETIAKAAPQSTPAETRQASPADSPPPSEGKPESQPAESTPAATPGVSETTVVVVPKKDSPDIGQLRSQPRTLIVGTEKEHLPDLKSAFAQAKPGDTILIRHRGPLEFDPVDLSGKTPLTIAGDRKNNEVDFWPILRQAAATANTKAERQTPEIRGLFHADRLELTLKKLHLAAGGPDPAKIGAVFGLGSGRVQLEQCTVTVGVQGFPSEPPGEPIPLVQTTPENEGRLDLVLDRTFLRGLRLQTCVQTQEAAEVDITATQTTWAGGPAPWLVAKDVPDQLRVTLRNCTIYNVPNLLRWVSPARQPSDKPLVDIQAEKSLFVGPYANKEPFIAWTPDESHDDLASASASGLARWQAAVMSCTGSAAISATPNAEISQPWIGGGPSGARQAEPWTGNSIPCSVSGPMATNCKRPTRATSNRDSSATRLRVSASPRRTLAPTTSSFPTP
ncbi:MAG: protein kinase [Planctomycetes bacterium]|nr:protein kinase [Planctomycetota bacterium]